MFAFIGAARAQQRAVDQQAMAIVAETRWWVSRTRLVQWWQNGRLARALHGPVQSVIRAAAGCLRAEAASGEAQPAIIQAVVTDAAESLSGIVLVSQGGESFQSRLDNVAATWRPLVAVEHDVGAIALEMMYQDPVCAEILVDVIAEAVANAVRHGGARNLTIYVAVVDEGGEAIAAEVIDDGRGRNLPPTATGATTGLGTNQLDTCALRWNYENIPSANRLSVALPLLRSNPTQAASVR
jgi:anti-sigma regulatory factor (Ser/Thr protein kinase)